MFNGSMRASRLLQILLLLQNRGRMTAPALALELECAPRTILRDVDAMTEAGLPIIVHQGRGGGIELGFNYRTLLTGLATDEAEALAVLLFAPSPALTALGLDAARRRAQAKLVESFPDRTRAIIEKTADMFRVEAPPLPSADPRIEALARAIRARSIIRIRARSPAPQMVHPSALVLRETWYLEDARPSIRPVPMPQWGDINISARPYA